MSKQDKELTMDELQKSLSDIFEGDYSEDEIADMIEKAKKSEDYDDEDGEVPGEQDTGPNSRGDDDDEDMEKAYDKMKKAYDKKAKEMKDLEAKMKKAKGVKKSEDEDIEKADKVEKSETSKEDILKSLTESFSKSFVTKDEYEDLSKSIEDMKETLGEIAKAPTGRRAIVNESQVIEKSEDGGSGNELSLTRNKRDLEMYLSNMIEKSEGASRTRLEKALINLNSGNVIPSVDILKSIESEQGVTFTK